ncbi:sulfate transporter 4.1 [Parathielavia appendiculata]|uniref:Sulfate transporter 4.1 n=1 Tax=Parathielavia appendiculata TaxID=2587402 RepID=A0AAN6Z1X4_9PEZI|nr:sulfate transporter 4.1 [Parathielavia appendiculata]
MERFKKAREALATDYTWNRVGRFAVTGARALPKASVEYVAEKFPIFQWIPLYDPRWLVNDMVAGLTVGLMLIPQGLSYARIATVPVQYGLMSSWLPSAIYAIMGTTKDVSTGPTSLISILSAQVIEAVGEESGSPSEIASAIAMMVGIYSLVTGLLKLGFLLQFISLPTLTGFISAVAITIILNQLDSLLGEPSLGDGTATQIHEVFQRLPQANGWACLVGFSSLLLLTLLNQAGKRWGKENKIIWFASITRAFITLVLFTGVGYAVNNPRGSSDKFLFGVAEVHGNGQEPPSIPKAELLSKVATQSIIIFVGSGIEHTGIAYGFGVENNYVPDQSQELTFLGVANIANSFFHAIGVGGAMSRTAVNSACLVRSPLSGFVTTAVVLVSIFKLVGTLYWIPNATLAAIVINAVFPLISPPAVFYRYWRASLADFVSSMIAMWVSLFVSTEIGIASSVGFNVAYVLLRQVFARVSTFNCQSELEAVLDDARKLPSSVPSDTRIFQLNDVIFLNAYRVKTSVIEAIKTHHAPIFFSAEGQEAERSWSVSREERLAKLRRRAGIHASSSLPPIQLVVLDFGRTNHIDTTACTHLKVLLSEIRAYGGSEVLVRFAGMSDYVRQRFERAGWNMICDGDETGEEGLDEGQGVRACCNVWHAVTDPKRRGSLRIVAGGEEEPKDQLLAKHNESSTPPTPVDIGDRPR